MTPVSGASTAMAGISPFALFLVFIFYFFKHLVFFSWPFFFPFPYQAFGSGIYPFFGMIMAFRVRTTNQSAALGICNIIALGTLDRMGDTKRRQRHGVGELDYTELQPRCRCHFRPRCTRGHGYNILGQ